jgi:hypothetical protein
MISRTMPVVGSSALVIISLSILVFFSTGAHAYAIPIPVFSPLDHVYNLTIDNQTHSIRYGFSPDSNNTAVVKNMSADYDSKSIRVTIDDNSTTTEERFFIVELPRKVIDANTTAIAGGCTASQESGDSWAQEHDLEYTIIVSRVDSEGDVAVYNGSINEECGLDTRVLSIEYPSGTSTIAIQGTTMIPEFSLSLSALGLALTMLGVIGVSLTVRYRTIV